MKLVALIWVVTFSVSAMAEYRAFSLRISNETTGAEREVVSTLDHLQYPGYYPLFAGERIELVDSWMCWGRTGDFRPICPNPKQRQP